MANTSPRPIPVDCYDTALCLVPPQELWGPVERLRALYDKSYEKWPPHVNLVYPFVRVQDLPDAAERIVSILREKGAATDESHCLNISLTSSGRFTRKQSYTIYRHDTDEKHRTALGNLRAATLQQLGQRATGRFNMHMSIAQSESADTDLDKFIERKVSLLPPLEWTATSLVILVRHRPQSQSGHHSMVFWGAIDLQSPRFVREPAIFNLQPNRDSALDCEGEAVAPRDTYSLSSEGLWERLSSESLTSSSSGNPSTAVPDNLVVAAYNVLAEFTYPPSRVRYPLLVQTLLSAPARADILVLEEVTDDFLSFILGDENLQTRYQYVTHGNPEQDDLEPLPSFLNLVILSRYPFRWKTLQLKRRHKNSAILTFPTIGRTDEQGFHPLVVATCHLSQGLTDGSVAAKKGELQRILDHLSGEYNGSPWVLAGDFNISTSRYTIQTALKKKAISNQTAQYLASLDTMMSDSGLLDAWLTARVEVGESSDDMRRPKEAWETLEGEQGATFDPTENQLAFKIVGSGFNNRPQRYDRILVKPEGMFQAGGFNMFGFDTVENPEGNGGTLHGSDHWGVRCLLRRTAESRTTPAHSLDEDVVPVQLRRAPEDLADTTELRKVLQQMEVMPGEEDEASRRAAFGLLKGAIEKAVDSGFKSGDLTGGTRTPTVVVAVGSYGLGVWTRDSDVDCLCIGILSPRTFFAIVTPRLRATSGIKILRRVKANTGTMLELEVGSIRMDLQYCSSASIAERWPDVMKRPASDPVFALPAQTLLKLKPARDMYYLRRSIPDFAQFRLAYLLLKTWAKERGIFSAKFGYLGGIHLSTMLVSVCKMLSRESCPVSVPDIIATFFAHYANFDWKTNIVFDPFFHKSLRYSRTFREPLCLLGWHAPILNTAHTASVPTVKALSVELRRANELLAQPGTTWQTLLGRADSAQSQTSRQPGMSGAASFVQEYKSYVKIDVHYWGPSQEKGNQYVGWLESRCVLLLVEIDKKVPQVVARIWPTKFVDEAGNVTSLGEGECDEYRGCFLIGLELTADETQTRTKEDVKMAEGALQSVLTQFEGRMRSDAKYYDAKTCWMAANVIHGADLGQIEPDKKDWGIYTGGEVSEEEEEDDEDHGDTDEDPDAGNEKKLAGTSKLSGPKSKVVIKPKGAGKFRTASDVMSRLRWDEKLDSVNFIVGYEDRFVGAMEKSLDSWKSEQTDEEFIPQHRILYFKRKSDGVIVWERSTRTDLIFGSGR